MEHKAFVSSTYEDLKAHRKHVIKSLQKAGIMVDPMENWTASTDEPKVFSRERVKGCDFCVLLVAFRRGFVPPNETLSITQLEYKAAKDLGMDVFVFLLNERSPWIREFDELGSDPEIRKWREELKKLKGVGFFELDPKSIEIAHVLTRWMAEKKKINQVTNNPELIPDEILQQHLDRIEHKFVDHMSGVDNLTPTQASARYIELLVEKVNKGIGAKSNEKTEEQKIKPDQEKKPSAGVEKLKMKPGQEKGSTKLLLNYAEGSGARLAVYGEGGAGKTTSLLKLAFYFAQKAKSNPAAPLPLYVKLNFFSRSEGGDELIRVVALSNSLQESEVRALWSNSSRRIVFLIDGFNEIRNDFQRKCALELEELMERLQHSYVVTSRPNTQLHTLSVRCKMEELNIVLLDDQQLEDFLIQHGAGNLFRQMGSEIKGLVRNPFLLWALAKSYAGLSMADLPKNKGELYRNLIDRYLFGEQEKNKEPSPTEYNYDLVKKPVLAYLALAMAKEQETRKAIDNNLRREISKKLKEIYTENEGLFDLKSYEFMPPKYSANGLLDEAVLNGVLRKIGDTVEFMHQSVQDYFTAVGMLTWQESEILSLAPRVSFTNKINGTALTNKYEGIDDFDAIVMLTGLKVQSDSLLKALQQHNPLVAASCLVSATNVSPTCRREFIGYLETLLQWQNENYRGLACDCLGVLKKISDERILQKLIEIVLYDEDDSAGQSALDALVQIKSDYTIHALIALALKGDNKDSLCKTIGRYLQGIDLSAAVPILFDEWRKSKGVTGKQRHTEILLAPGSLLDEENISLELSKIRLQACKQGDEKAAIDAKEAKENLKEWRETYKNLPEWQPGLENKEQRIEDENLAKGLSEMTIAEIIESMRDGYNEESAIVELRNRDVKEVIVTLFEMAPKFSFIEDIQLVITILKNINEAQAIQHLRALLQGNDKIKQRRYAIALGLLKQYEYIDLVKQALKEESAGFRYAAAKVLGNLGTEEAEAAILQMVALENKEDVFRELVKALGKMNSQSSFEMLYKLFLQPVTTSYSSRFSEESKQQVIRKALIARIGEKQLFDLLKEAALAENTIIRMNAIQELIYFNSDESAISDILNTAWMDPEPKIRKIALDELSFVKSDPELADIIETALNDQDDSIRKLAVDIYVEREPEKSRNKLLEIALSDPGKDVRDNAIWYLGRFVQWTFDQLTAMLKQETTEKRLAVIYAIGKLASTHDFSYGVGALSDDSENEKLLDPLLQIIKNDEDQARLQAIRVIRDVYDNEKDDLIMPELVDLAWHGKTVEVREEAALILESNDQGFDALYKPIWDHLDDTKQYPALIKKIGEDQPFLPRNSYVFALRGTLYLDMEQFEQALADFKVAESLNFTDVWFWDDYGYLNDELGQYKEARSAALKWLELAPDNAEAHLALGWYEYKLGNYNESIDEAKLALCLDPTLAMAAFNLALTYLTRDQFNEAKSAYGKALAICKQMDEEKCSADMKIAKKDFDELLNAKPELQLHAEEIRSQIFVTRIAPTTAVD